MPNIPCCINAPCISDSNPLENLSAEAPDRELYLGYNSGYGNFEPPVNGSWGTLGCVSLCQSTISQQDADNCAANQQVACTVQDGTGNGGGGGWKDPEGNPVPVFFNGPAACQISCPDGLPFTFRVAAGQFSAPNQAYADLVAQSVACILAQDEALCLNAISGACLNQAYSQIITPFGGTPPFVFQITSGSLPPGISFSQPDPNFALLSGTPTATGNYTFTVRVIDRFGLFMVKNYTLGVVGITNSPTSATQGSAYSFTFTAAGGTPPYTFAVVSGSLPNGLSMDSSGNITGTPTTAATFNFSVSVTDSSP